MSLRVAVTGGRDYANVATVHRELDKLHATEGISLLIHGACPTGADFIADEWAKQKGVSVDPWPAAWKKLGPAAGPIRNLAMIRGTMPDLLVVFPGNKGTQDCVKHAIRFKIPMLCVYDQVLRTPFENM